jgi:hypothetical protein
VKFDWQEIVGEQKTWGAPCLAVLARHGKSVISNVFVRAGMWESEIVGGNNPFRREAVHKVADTTIKHELEMRHGPLSFPFYRL